MNGEHDIRRYKIIRTNYRVLFIIILATMLCDNASAQQKAPKVLIIGIDGCRPDALIQASTPHIDALNSTGAFTPIAQTRPVTSSGPGWSNMLTGVWQNKHGVVDNSFNGSHFDLYPHFFDRIKANDPTIYCASVVRWSPIQSEIPKNADIDISITSSDQVVTDEASDLLKNYADLDVLFVHLDDVDHAGHTYGFSPLVPQYIEAIEEKDAQVGQMVDALRSRKNYANEDWLIMVSTDHGGLGTTHGGPSEEERTIFIVVNGERVKHQVITASKQLTGQRDMKTALSLDGDGYGQIPVNQLNVGTMQDFTIELKVKSEGWQGDPAIISNKDWDSGYNKGFVIAGTSDGKSWKFNMGDGEDRLDLNGNSIADGQWHQIVVSYARNGLKTLYQDGQLVDSSEKIFNTHSNSGMPIGLGQDGTLNYNYFFQGDVDEIRIWDQALDTEILQNQVCQGIDEYANSDHLLAYWDFEHSLENGLNGNISFDMTGGYHYLDGPNLMKCYDYTRVPQIVDVAVTALTYMRIPIDPHWNLDGHPFGLEDQPPIATEENPIVIYPNPNNGKFEISMYSREEGNFYVHITDIQGKPIWNAVYYKGGQKAIDLSTLASGVYLVVVENLGITWKRKLLITN